MTMTPQVQAALDIANERRLARSALHHQVRDTGDFVASCLVIGKLFEDGPPACVASLRVPELLQWIVARGYRKDRLISEALAAAGCSEFRLVRELTPRQCSRIAVVLTSYAYLKDAA